MGLNGLENSVTWGKHDNSFIGRVGHPLIRRSMVWSPATSVRVFEQKHRTPNCPWRLHQQCDGLHDREALYIEALYECVFEWVNVTRSVQRFQRTSGLERRLIPVLSAMEHWISLDGSVNNWFGVGSSHERKAIPTNFTYIGNHSEIKIHSLRCDAPVLRHRTHVLCYGNKWAPKAVTSLCSHSVNLIFN